MSEPPDSWQRYNIDNAIKYSIEAIKAVFIMNGAAAIALLAFLGSYASKDDPIFQVSIEGMKDALICFGFGALLGGLTFFLAYIAQIFFAATNSGEMRTWPAELFRWSAAICFIFATIAFGAGVYVAANALSDAPTAEGVST